MMAIREVMQDCFSDVRNPQYVPNYVLNAGKIKKKSIGFAMDFFQPGEIPEKAIDVSIGYRTDTGVKRSEGFLWATNIRLFFAGKVNGGLFKSPYPFYREFAYSHIARVEFRKGNFSHGGSIVLHIRTNSASGDFERAMFDALLNTRGEALRVFADYASKKVETVAKTPQEKEGDDLVAKLERLNELKTREILTEEEFDAAKRQLLKL